MKGATGSGNTDEVVRESFALSNDSESWDLSRSGLSIRSRLPSLSQSPLLT